MVVIRFVWRPGIPEVLDHAIHVSNLEQNLAKAKQAHGAVSEEAKQHKTDLDDLRKENEDVKAKLEDVTSQAKRAIFCSSRRKERRRSPGSGEFAHGSRIVSLSSRRIAL